MDTANSSAIVQPLKNIEEQKRIAQLERKIVSLSKQLDEKGTDLKKALEQNASLKDRIGTLEQEKLEVSLLIETLTKSRDRLLIEKNEQRAKIVDELGAQNAAELDREQTEATNAQMRLTEMLKKAAETHRKLEDERNQLFGKHKFLEDNLEAYQRCVLDQFHQEMDTRCSQMGKGMRNAFADIVGQMAEWGKTET